MARLADTLACELAQSAFNGVDAPGVVSESGIRYAIHRGVPGDFKLEDIGEWASPAMQAILTAPTQLSLEIRVISLVVAAMIIGARLAETNGT